MTMDINDFYLNTPMKRYKYTQLKISDMPNDVIEHYNLHEIATPDEFIYCEIQKGMYGLPQAEIIAPFFMGLALAQTAHTGIGRGPSTNCGRTSTITSVSSRNRPLGLARWRMPAAKSLLTRKPLVPARRLLLALLALARRRLHVANAPLKLARPLPPNSSS